MGWKNFTRHRVFINLRNKYSRLEIESEEKRELETVLSGLSNDFGEFLLLFLSFESITESLKHTSFLIATPLKCSKNSTRSFLNYAMEVWNFMALFRTYWWKDHACFFFINRIELISKARLEQKNNTNSDYSIKIVGSLIWDRTNWNYCRKTSKKNKWKWYARWDPSGEAGNEKRKKLFYLADERKSFRRFQLMFDFHMLLSQFFISITCMHV